MSPIIGIGGNFLSIEGCPSGSLCASKGDDLVPCPTMGTWKKDKTFHLWIAKVS